MPVVVLAVIAVAVLLPESRSADRPGIDIVGVILSSAGLAGLTYGFIKARQDGLDDAVVLADYRGRGRGAGRAGGWERWLTGRDRTGSGGSLRGGTIRPLIELGCSGQPSPGAPSCPRWSRSRCSASSS